ncbi:MAG TPA: SDR family NAD(P)-dependent oxidoreductase [Acidimicrobiales bacterium]|nr:SDR family NAD(P)-dependent oxidoreductase [Acidimicrobiales bacterium]
MATVSRGGEEGRKPLVELQGRRVVVTGATSGIGREITGELARRGASVVAVGRDEEELADLTRFGGRIEPFRTDIVSAEGQTSLVERAGRIHALVNDAGVGWVGLSADMPVEEIERIVSVNLQAVMTLTRRLLPSLNDPFGPAPITTASTISGPYPGGGARPGPLCSSDRLRGARPHSHGPIV